ncbi:MAG TPA: hypothetical protein VGK85_14010, partial [Myxococcaceae bacterium]
MRKPVPRVEVPRASPVFQSQLRSAAARMADPGPRQLGHGVSGRTDGQAPGRHARSHPRRDRPESGTGQPPAGRGAVVFSGNPRRRR